MRLPKLDPDQMSPRQREVADSILAARGKIGGPYQVWLNSPELCERVESLGAYVMKESSLPQRLRELGLLMASRASDAQYSWNAHADKALSEGLSAEVLEAVARNEEPAFDRPEDAAFYRFAHEVLTEHFVRDETFAEALAHFGAQGLVDIIGSLGNCFMLGLLLNAFKVDLQADRTPPYPDIHGFERVASALT